MRKGTRPALLFLAVSATAFGLAEAHVLKPSAGTASAGSTVQLGDAARGTTLFQQRCAGCHGEGGKGGGVGPRLVGAALTPARVKGQIDAGGGVMPARLVTGQDEADVLAFVATITAK